MTDEPDFGPDIDYVLDFSIEDIHLLYDCVKRRIESWEGAPSRHPFEQEHLCNLRDELYRAVLDHKFKYME